MYCMGLKQLTWFHSGIKHLDAGTAMVSEEKEKMLIYSDFRFKTIFWHRFIYLSDEEWLSRFVEYVVYRLYFRICLIRFLGKGAA